MACPYIIWKYLLSTFYMQTLLSADTVVIYVYM